MYCTQLSILPQQYIATSALITCAYLYAARGVSALADSWRDRRVCPIPLEDSVARCILAGLTRLPIADGSIVLTVFSEWAHYIAA